MTLAGFPHSEICGLTVVCTYPQLIAADHVLHRLLMPRHSPCALNILLLYHYDHYLALFNFQGARTNTRAKSKALSLEYWILVIDTRNENLNSLGSQELKLDRDFDDLPKQTIGFSLERR